LLVLFVPSITFWTVGLIKEAFVIPVFFLMYYLFRKAEAKAFKDIYSILFMVVLIYITWNIKYYYIAIFLLAGILHVFMKSNVHISFRLVIGTLISVLIFLGIIGLLHPNLIVNKIPEVIYQSYQSTCKLPSFSDCISFSLDGSWMSIIENIPKASVQVFYCPTFLQLHNKSSIFAGIESHALLLLFVHVTYRWVFGKIVMHKEHLFWLFFIMLCGSLLLMASPNIGSFSRYRIIYLPAFCYILFKSIELPNWIHLIFLKYLKKE